MSAACIMNECEIFTESVRIRSGTDELAGELGYALRKPLLACALFNPHPFMGGQMENNVIRELARSLAAEQAITLRFDYSGVGGSSGSRTDVASAMLAFWETGHAPQDPKMIADARAATGWLHAAAQKPMVLIGYSFGSHVAAQLVDDRTVGLVLIAPTLKQHDFSALSACKLPTLIIYSDNDFATPRGMIESWIRTLANVHSMCIEGGEHFFKQRESQIAQACGAFVRSLTNREEATCR